MFYVFQILAFLAGKWRQKVLAKFCFYYFRISNDNFWGNSPQGCQKWKKFWNMPSDSKDITAFWNLIFPPFCSLALNHVKEKALHPFLSYNSEVWGMYTKQDLKKWDSSPIEKIHLKVCKRYLEENNKGSNIACRAELGRLPPLILINIKIMKDFVCLNNKLR